MEESKTLVNVCLNCPHPECIDKTTYGCELVIEVIKNGNGRIGRYEKKRERWLKNIDKLLPFYKFAMSTSDIFEEIENISKAQVRSLWKSGYLEIIQRGKGNRGFRVTGVNYDI